MLKKLEWENGSPLFLFNLKWKLKIESWSQEDSLCSGSYCMSYKTSDCILKWRLNWTLQKGNRIRSWSRISVDFSQIFSRWRRSSYDPLCLGAAPESSSSPPVLGKPLLCGVSASRSLRQQPESDTRRRLKVTLGVRWLRTDTWTRFSSLCPCALQQPSNILPPLHDV